MEELESKAVNFLSQLDKHAPPQTNLMSALSVCLAAKLKTSLLD